MIHELNRSDFYKCAKLAAKRGRVEARAVIGGINPGRVFSNSVESPRSALVWLGNMDGFCFVGDPHEGDFIESVAPFVEEVISPEAKNGLEWFECFGDTSDWDWTIKQIFSDRPLTSWTQLVYGPDGTSKLQNAEVHLPEEFQLTSIAECFAEGNITNLEYVERKISSFWGDVENFLRRGIGFVIADRWKVVSICLSGFVHGTTHAVDIETEETHRQESLGSNVAHAFVRECYGHKLVPYWDCMESNEASRRIASKLGLIVDAKYAGYAFKL